MLDTRNLLSKLIISQIRSSTAAEIRRLIMLKRRFNDNLLCTDFSVVFSLTERCSSGKGLFKRSLRDGASSREYKPSYAKCAIIELFYKWKRLIIHYTDCKFYSYSDIHSENTKDRNEKNYVFIFII